MEFIQQLAEVDNNESVTDDGQEEEVRAKKLF